MLRRDEMPLASAPPPPGPPLAAVLRSAQSRLLSPKLTNSQKRALERHLERALVMFDEMVEEINSAPREPQMRRRQR